MALYVGEKAVGGAEGDIEGSKVVSTFDTVDGAAIGR